MTIALIITLAYEILLKLTHIFIPSLFYISPVPGITSMISFISGVIIILFVFLFYKEESSNKKVGLALILIIGCFVPHTILRLPITREIFDFKIIRLLGEIVGFIRAILLFILLIFYRREIPSNEKLLKHATIFITIMFGFGIIKSLFSLISFARFFISGITIDFSPIFFTMIFILFLISHASIIYFLYHYYQFKFQVYSRCDEQKPK